MKDFDREEAARLEKRIAELSEEAHDLDLLNRLSVAIASDLDVEHVIQAVTDAGVELSKAGFGAFFSNASGEAGEAYTLDALSGAPHAAIEKFLTSHNAALVEPIFHGTEIVRSDDILADARGDQSPGDLPIRSSVVVAVRSRAGEVLGGLFFGHSQTGRFGARVERHLASLVRHAAAAIDNALLYQDVQREVVARTRSEGKLQKLNERLRAGAAQRRERLVASTTRLEETQQYLRLLIDTVVDYAIFMLDRDGNVVSWNPGAQRIKGYARHEIIGQHFSRFYSEADRVAGLPTRALAAAAEFGKYEMEGWRVRKDGTSFWANVVITAVKDAKGDLIGFAKVTRDLTERHAADERLRQAQKMEAVGQLTGGVAHDFNNLLTVIVGNVEALKRRLAEQSDPRLERLANSALHGAQRAALLVHRLLAFARNQPLAPRSASVNSLIPNVSEMLRRTLGETIVVETVLAGGVWPIFADISELESALLNLAINARDAMPDGGQLTIETANVFLDDAYAKDAEIAAGQYVGIFVSDTGTGMSSDIVAKAFEPFFTTKEPGHGTGLGLSQVYGFIKQSGGHVKIYSEIGIGTTVKLYLPRYIADDAAQGKPSTEPPLPTGRGETILVVEDDADVRSFTTETLHELGYRVLAARDGAEGLRLLDAHREIVILFTDVGLPGGMNGRQFADEAKRRRSDLKILFASGYARNAIVHHGRLDPGVELVSKPFTYATLSQRVRQLLDDDTPARRETRRHPG